MFLSSFSVYTVPLGLLGELRTIIFVFAFIFSSIFFAETLKSVVISLFTTTGTPSAISTIAE